MGLVHKFMVTQRAMERAMLGVSLTDKVRNEVIREIQSNGHSLENKQDGVAVGWPYLSFAGADES